MKNLAVIKGKHMVAVASHEVVGSRRIPWQRHIAGCPAGSPAACPAAR